MWISRSCFGVNLLSRLGGIVCCGIFILAPQAREPMESAQSPAAGLADVAPGHPNRSPDFDVLPGFISPPPGYGEVAFYWWQGDPLIRERILWQMEKLAGKGIMGLQINYAHGDSGNPHWWGLTYPSDPALFSEPWWKLVRWMIPEARKRGMSVSLSDYTLGAPGQGFWTDEILREYPEMCGSVLAKDERLAIGGNGFHMDLPDNLLTITAYRLQGKNIEPGSGIDLRPYALDKLVRWVPPKGSWQVVAVFPKTVSPSLDPLHPELGRRVIEKFFQRFEDHCPGEAGKGLNYFFSDELSFGVSGNLWTKGFAAEFIRRKGYDLAPELPALFVDIGPRTPKIRLDYRDVMVALAEEGYFRPVFDWHTRRGMIYGCDHGGRGRDVAEFGDYFRTQRWMSGPGNDSPRLSADVVKNKVASSIAHLYERPRTWLEGYHSSGWGTTVEDLVDATARNYVLGSNLLTLHGLYYSTHGGFWEWAPPCNHFRMPYWEHMGEFLHWSERLSFVLSQGVHRCDVALLYPVAPMEAGMGGKESVETAFTTAEHLAKEGIDFDFVDFESLARARVEARELRVAGEAYRVLILPSMAAVRYSTLQKALEFYRAGGVVIAVAALPEASDRVGRVDPQLDAAVTEIFGRTADEARVSRDNMPPTTSSTGGLGIHLRTPDAVSAEIRASVRPDFELLESGSRRRPVQALHRKIGPRDVYLVVGASPHATCFFRARGKVELWDPWSGRIRPLHEASTSDEGTRIRMPGENSEAQLIVFNPGEPGPGVEQSDLTEITDFVLKDADITAHGYARTAGRQSVTVRLGDGTLQLSGEAPAPPTEIAIEGLWDFELRPTLDNRWGDFRLPASDQLLGAEARKFLYSEETGRFQNWQLPRLDDSQWRKVTYSYGPRFWKLGPWPADSSTDAIENRIAAMKEVDPTVPVEIGGRKHSWHPYEYSLRWGVEDDPGHQGYHGLKEMISDDFIALGARKEATTQIDYLKEPEGTQYYLWTAARSARGSSARILAGGLMPVAVWLNGKGVDLAKGTVMLHPGCNILLLRYDEPGRGHLVLESGEARQIQTRTPLSMSWYDRRDLTNYDVFPQRPRPVGWYRFTSPPGLQSMTLTVHGKLRAWADGLVLRVEPTGRRAEGATEYRAEAAHSFKRSAVVALRIEQEHGFYAGAALPEPVEIHCVSGQTPLGDWSRENALESYSGGAWYRKTIELPAIGPGDRVMLDLGRVAASAEVHVNGRLAGIRVAPPWRLYVSGLVRSGQNRLEILVYNTLSNHYSTIPTRYRGAPVSGLLGPVRVTIQKPVTLRGRIPEPGFLRGASSRAP